MSGLNDSNTTDEHDNSLVGIMGGTDNTRIGNIGDRLKVISESNSNTLTNFRSLYYSSNFALITSYQTIFSKSGAGLFLGFRLEASAEPYAVRLTVDGDVCFDLERAAIDAIDLEEWTYAGLQRYFSMSSGSAMEFFPTVPINYSTSFDIAVKRTVSWGFNITNRIFMYTEE